MGFYKKNRCGFKWIKLVFLFPSPIKSVGFPFTMSLREISGICVRRVGRCGEDVGGFGNVGNCD